MYCRLLLHLFEGELAAASDVLRELGYATNQTHRAPERDAEFFSYLFRDAVGNRQRIAQDRNELSKKYAADKKIDEQNGVREKGET